MKFLRIFTHFEGLYEITKGLINGLKKIEKNTIFIYLKSSFDLNSYVIALTKVLGKFE